VLPSHLVNGRPIYHRDYDPLWAEAQAMGVPAVVQPLGSVVERVIDGVTGHIAGDDDSFAAAAIALLRDDDLWRRYHAEALARQRGQSWDEVAAQFEALI